MIGLTTCVRAWCERGVCRAPTTGHPAPILTSRDFRGGWGFSSRTVLRERCAWVLLFEELICGRLRRV